MPRLHLRSKEDVRLAIRKRGNEIARQMTPKEFFQSPEFISYAKKLVSFMLKDRPLLSITLLHDERPGSVTAYTNGTEITANTGNDLVRHGANLEQQFQSAMGLLFHEASHMLFMDFDFTANALSSIERGDLFGDFSTNNEPVFVRALSELQSYSQSASRIGILTLYKELWNILNDGHDELALKVRYPGFVADCIDSMDQIQHRISPSLSDSIKAGASDLSLLLQCMLDYCLFGCYKLGEESEDTDRIMGIMKDIEPLMESTLHQHNTHHRWNCLNQIVLRLTPFLKSFTQDNKSGQTGSADSSASPCGSSGGSSSSSDSADADGSTPSQVTPGETVNSLPTTASQLEGRTASPPELDSEMLESMLSQLLQNHGVSPSPENGHGTGMHPGDQAFSFGLGDISDLQTLLRDVSQQLATESVQMEMNQELLELIRNSNTPLIHRPTTLDVHRDFTPDQAGYERRYERIRACLKSMIAKTQLLVDEMNDDSVENHRRFGPMIVAQESYRPDSRYFAKRKIPADIPDMSICILMDCSNSMKGKKLDYSIEAVIMLERYANALGIPIMIASHNVTVKKRCNLNIYTDFASAMPDKDRFSLANIRVAGRNRDGLPISVCCDLLSRRQEDIRILLVLSDGAPNDGKGYRGEAAREDIRTIIKTYRRKGLVILGAAIDKDRDVIESIYGDHFLSIDDLSTLPKTLIRIIKQKLI